MGGDHGPEEVVKAAARLSLDRDDLRTILVGPADGLTGLLADLPYDPAALSVVHTDQWVRPDTPSREQLVEQPDASILLATRLVAEGRADAAVTAGSTGAAILASAEQLGRVPGVRRACLAAVIPTERRHGPRGDPFALLLDVGATLDATARDLVTFAAMGSAYAAAVSGNPNPRVALLSNGAEPHKGPPAVVEAHRILSGLDILEFAGNVEGLDIPKGTVDVVVTSGFLGNVVLKMLEGLGEVVADLTADVRARKYLQGLGLLLLSSGVERVRKLLDWESYGGAPILGFTRPVIKAHGRSRDRAIANACKVAAKAARSDMVRTVERAMACLPAEEPSP